MIRVLIVDDSATARKNISQLLLRAGGFEVVGTARSGKEAIQQLSSLEVHLVALDVFLEKESAADLVLQLLGVRSVPVVLLSEAKRDSDEVFRALSAGAVDFMRKPVGNDPVGNITFVNALRALSENWHLSASMKAEADVRGVVVVGSSTGGPNALRALLGLLPEDFAWPILIAQHVASGFEDGLARWLAEGSQLAVSVVERSIELPQAGVWLGQCGADLSLVSGRLVTKPAGPRGYHPSADILFSSAAKELGSRVAAVVLSGIGSDGTEGAGKIRAAGGYVLAQDKTSSIVAGMPESVRTAGHANQSGPPAALALQLLSHVRALAGWGARF